MWILDARMQYLIYRAWQCGTCSDAKRTKEKRTRATSLSPSTLSGLSSQSLWSPPALCVGVCERTRE